MSEQFAEYKQAIAAKDEGAAAAIADPAEHVEETAEQQPENGGESRVEKELRERSEGAQKPEVKRDWRDGKNVPTGVKKRFEKITTEKYELQQRAERAEARLKELESSGQQPQRTQENKRESLRELADRLEREKAGPDAASQKRDVEDPTIQQRIAEGRQRYPDWDDVFERSRKDNIQIPMAAIEAAQKLSNHTDIFYYLARNPALAADLLTHPEPAAAIQQYGRTVETISAANTAWSQQDPAIQAAVYRYLEKDTQLATKITEMAPAQAYKEIVKLAVKLERQQPESKAPAPIKPVTTAGKSDLFPPVDEMSLADYKKFRAR